MKFTLNVCMLVILAMLLGACGEKVDEAKDALGAMKSLAESAGDIKETANTLEKKREERIKKGDTTSMEPDALLAYLPSSIGDLAAQEAEKNTMGMQGMSWTQVKRDYTSDKDKVTITLVDYNGSQMGYLGATAMFNLKFRTENANEIKGTFTTDNELINGFEEFKKKTGNVTVMYGLGGRFLLTITANNQTGVDRAKSIAEGMKLKELAAK